MPKKSTSSNGSSLKAGHRTGDGPSPHALQTDAHLRYPGRSQECGAWEEEKLGGAIERLAIEMKGGAASFERCREYERNFFIRSVLEARLGFYNAGLTIKPAESKGKDGEATQAWLDDRRNKAKVRKFVVDAWREYLVTDVLISFWRKTSFRPMLLMPENVVFSDKYGVETLEIKHGLSTEEIRKWETLSKKEKELLARAQTVKLWHPDEAPDAEKVPISVLSQYWFFEVLKKEKMGRGLGAPGLSSVFHTLQQNQAMEVGDVLWAELGRKVYEEHTVGHDIKSGQFAGANRHFLTEKRRQGIEKGLKGKSGVVTLVKNFDHLVSYNRPDPKSFDAKKYDAVVNRLLWWALPVGHMILAKGISPYLMDTLKTMALEARADMGLHLEYVIGEAFDVPGPVSVKWSNKVFKDSRLALDVLKTGLSTGPLSQRTFLEENDFDPELELTRKAEEAKKPDDVMLPRYDGNHGKPQDPAGRKRGSPNTGK